MIVCIIHQFINSLRIIFTQQNLTILFANLYNITYFLKYFKYFTCHHHTRTTVKSGHLNQFQQATLYSIHKQLLIMKAGQVL